MGWTPEKRVGSHGEGISLRDHFAAVAMPEVLRVMVGQVGVLPKEEIFRVVVAQSYEVADAMLLARGET